MKKLLFLFAVAALSACMAPNEYKIAGQLSGEGMDSITEVKLFAGEELLAQAGVENGRFTLEGVVDAPVIAELTDQGDNTFASLFVEPGKITVAVAGESSEVKGTPANDGNAVLKSKLDDLLSQLKAEDLTEERREELYGEYDGVVDAAIDGNMDNVLGLFLFATQRSRELEPEQIDAFIARFSERWQQHKYMDVVRDRLEAMRKTAVGVAYIDVMAPDAEGNTLPLSDYVGEGKYVLLDFWASWCNPCMAEVPHLKEAYDKYHDKGFEIFGVSLDNKREAWLKAIDEKQLNWVHVSNLAGWDSPARTAYGVDGIPASFLIGPEGTIVARNPRGNKLMEILDEVMK